MNVDLTPLVVTFGLVLARVGSFVGTCPLFVPENVPMTVRAGLSAVLAGVMTATLPQVHAPDAWPQAVGVEVLLGIALASCVRLVAVGIGFAGELIDVHLGFGFARLINPTMGEETTPLMHLSQLLAGLTFLFAGGQHRVVAGLAHSFVLLPPGAGHFSLGWTALLIDRFGQMLQVGLLLALPIVAAMMCVQLGLALLSRLAPQLNVWALGLLGTCGLGLLALYAFFPAFSAAMMQLWRSPDVWALGEAR